MHFPPQLTKFPSRTCINEGVDSRVGVPEPEDENNPTFGKAHLDVVMMMVIIILDMIKMIQNLGQNYFHDNNNCPNIKALSFNINMALLLEYWISS